MIALPAGPFGTIVADPPWAVRAGPPITVGKWSTPGGGALCLGKRAESRRLAYPTMSVGEIAALPVASIAAADAHLYLWTINRYVEQAFAVARAWGFTFSTILTWSKRPMGGGLGGLYGITSEHVLFCRRGRQGRSPRVRGTVFTWKRQSRHSMKPAAFYDMVAGVSPGPRVELFARGPRLGWTVWGDEATGRRETV